MRLKRPILAPLVTGLVTGLVSAAGAAPATPAHAHPIPSVLAQVPPAPPAPPAPTVPAPAPAPNAPNATIAQRVVSLIADKLVVDAALVVPSADLRKDLGGDSIDLVELVMALESAFSVTISDEDAEKLLTVGDIISYCEHHGK